MSFRLAINPHKLHIFLELRKRRLFVAELTYEVSSEQYKLVYDKEYTYSKHAIPLGPELDIFQQMHLSKPGELFPSILDRIPEKKNPAYASYCESQGIDPCETNLIILLGSIGKRGPSSFIFEKIYKSNFSIQDIKNIREEINVTQHDFAKALGVSVVTLQKLEYGVSKDPNTLKLLEIYFSFPEVAIWNLKQNARFIMSSKAKVLSEYFENLLDNQQPKV